MYWQVKIDGVEVALFTSSKMAQWFKGMVAGPTQNVTIGIIFLDELDGQGDR